MVAALLQSDSRVCTSRATDDGAYWWASVIANGRWARAHGYEHYVYCFVRGCSHSSGEERHVAYCKIVAIIDALGRGVSPLLYLDTDAFVQQPSLTLEELTRSVLADHTPYAGRFAGHIFFGGNAPYAGQGHWSTRGTHSCAPPNTAVILIRNTPTAAATLREWWDSRAGKWAFTHSWEQRQLWELWRATPRLAPAFRVAAPNGSCLRTMFFFPAPPSIFSQARPSLNRLVLPSDYAPAPSRTAAILHMDSASVCRTPGASAFKCSRRRRALTIALAPGPFNLSYRPTIVRADKRRLRTMYNVHVSANPT